MFSIVDAFIKYSLLFVNSMSSFQSILWALPCILFYGDVHTS